MKIGNAVGIAAACAALATGASAEVLAQRATLMGAAAAESGTESAAALAGGVFDGMGMGEAAGAVSAAPTEAAAAPPVLTRPASAPSLTADVPPPQVAELSESGRDGAETGGVWGFAVG